MEYVCVFTLFSIFITIPLLTHLTFSKRALQVVLFITKIARVFSTKKKWRFSFERLLVVCFVLTRSFRLIYYYLLCCCRVLDFLFAYHRCYHLHVLVAVLSCLFFFCVTHLSHFGCFGWITFQLFQPFCDHFNLIENRLPLVPKNESCWVSLKKRQTSKNK